jgi:hypothetical protein
MHSEIELEFRNVDFYSCVIYRYHIFQDPVEKHISASGVIIKSYSFIFITNIIIILLIVKPVTPVYTVYLISSVVRLLSRLDEGEYGNTKKEPTT